MRPSSSILTSSVPMDLQSLVDSHDQPFVVIDQDYRIMAVNSAYERAFGISRELAVGQPCYKISHNNDVPCHESGEDCPHVKLFENGKQNSCLHVHYDANHRMCQVRVTAYPLQGSNGELFMGELVQAIASPSGQRNNGRQMVGKSAPFLAVMEQLQMVAAAQAPVLLQGETGTGKELAARFIHYNSPRAEQPFLTVDCTVLTEPLFEAEVFGHARGAFTGSVGERTGLYEQADGGSLFLDEVGELPLSQQAKLLRVLESGQYRRVGGKSHRNANVRIICATNRHLWDEVTAGRFREDLYYRIACLAVRLPPLRERLDDIQLLVPELLEPVSNTMSRDFKLTADALDRLRQYDYPGNVRELRNILFIAATHSSSGEIDGATVDEVLEIQVRAHSKPQPCPEPVETGSAKTDAVFTSPQRDVSDSMVDVEARHIARLLEQHNNRRKVAEALGISERTLYRKISKYKLGK